MKYYISELRIKRDDLPKEGEAVLRQQAEEELLRQLEANPKIFVPGASPNLDTRSGHGIIDGIRHPYQLAAIFKKIEASHGVTVKYHFFQPRGENWDSASIVAKGHYDRKQGIQSQAVEILEDYESAAIGKSKTGRRAGNVPQKKD